MFTYDKPAKLQPGHGQALLGQAGINNDAGATKERPARADDDREKRDNNRTKDDAEQDGDGPGENEGKLNAGDPGVIINVDQMDKGKGNEQEGINVVNVNENVAGLGDSGAVAVDILHHGPDLDHAVDELALLYQEPFAAAVGKVALGGHLADPGVLVELVDVVLHEPGILGLRGHDSGVFLDVALLLLGDPGPDRVAHGISDLVQYDVADVAPLLPFNVGGAGIDVDEAGTFIVVGAVLDKVVEPGADEVELGLAEELLDLADGGLVVQELLLAVQGGAFGVLVLPVAVLVVPGQGAVELGIDVVVVVVGPSEVEAVRLVAGVDAHDLVGLGYGCHVQLREP